MSIFIYPAISASIQASHASQDANRASSAARRSQNAADVLQTRLDRLALVTEALWTLLRERVGISDEELLERIKEVDLSDGALDGKVRHGTRDCPQCGRVLSKRNPRCIYCGAEGGQAPFENT